MPDDAFLEDLLADCFERIETEGISAVEQACARHPEHAETIRTAVMAALESGIADLGETFDSRLPESIGGYEIIERLGAGGMGIVLRAQDPALSRQVALKVLRPEFALSDRALTRFRVEAEAAAALRHPNIVPVHAVGVDHSLPWYAMELIDGVSMAEVVRALRRRDADAATEIDLCGLILALRGREASASRAPVRPWGELAVALATDVADALAHSHSVGVLHRDVKPSNLMVGVDGRIVLVDFGLARRDGVSSVTRTGMQPGSLPYMAPEQLRGETVDVRTDVYALGVTLYEMLALRHPYESGHDEALRAAILGGDLRSPRRHDPKITREAEAVCMTAMACEPHRRYRTADDLMRDLATIRDGGFPRARTPGIAARIARSARRHPAKTLAAALAFLLVAVVPTLVALREMQTRRLAENQRDRIRDEQSLTAAARDEARAEARRALGAEAFLRHVLENSGGWTWLKTPAERAGVREQALATLAALDDEPLRKSRLALSIASNLRILAMYEESIEVAGIAAEAAERCGDEDLLVRARLERGEYRVQLGVDLEAAQADLDFAVGAGADAGALQRARAHTALGEARLLRGADADVVRPLLETAAANVMVLDGDLANLHALTMRLLDRLLEVGGESTARSLADSHRAVLARSPSGGGGSAGVAVEAVLIELDLRAGEPEVEELLDGAISRFDETLGDGTPAAGLAKGRLGGMLFKWGRRAPAERLLRAALAGTADWNGDPASRGKFACDLATLLAAEHRYLDALTYARQAVASRSGRDGPLPAAAHCLHGLGRIDLALGNHDRAMESFEQALGLCRAGGVTGTSEPILVADLRETRRRKDAFDAARADAARHDAAGDMPSAAESHGEALELLGEHASPYVTIRIHTALGNVLARDSEWHDAAEAFRAARADARACKFEETVLFGQLTSDLGHCLTRLDEREQARPLLLDAVRVLTATDGAGSPRTRRARARLAALD